MRYSVILFSLIFSLFFLLCSFKPLLADVITLKDGGEPFNGRIIKETDAEVTVKLKVGGTARFPKSWIKDIKKEDIPDDELYTAQDIYLAKNGKTDPKDAKAQLELAEWCLKNSTPENGLADMAIRHFNTAKELDPAIAELSGNNLKDAVDKKAGELYKIAETDFNAERYFDSEKTIRSIIAMSPESDYAGKAKKLLTKIWGETRANKILNAKDDLSQAAFSKDPVPASAVDEIKEKYLVKYMDKAKECEERAGEVSRGERPGYYALAINCYRAALYSRNANLRDSAKSKIQQSLKHFFEDNPVPRDGTRLAEMITYLKIVEDKDFVARIADDYFKAGQRLIKKARKLKQPEKGQTAQGAFFCFSLAARFSNDEKIKRTSAVLITETQRLERAKK